MNASDINTDRLVSDLRTVTRDAEELLKTVSGERGNGSNEMRARLSSAIESAKATYHRLEDKAVAGAKATDKAMTLYQRACHCTRGSSTRSRTKWSGGSSGSVLRKIQPMCAHQNPFMML